MIFSPKRRSKIVAYQFPNVTINNEQLSFVNEFKYLGHIINNSQLDDADIYRERRNLFYRCNMLARRFCARQHIFPAYSWVLSLWLAGKSCRVSVCQHVRAITRSRAAEGHQARERVPCAAVRKQERLDSAECIIQRRLVLRVDSVPSCKLSSARTRRRVLSAHMLSQFRPSVRPSVRLSVRHTGDSCKKRLKIGYCSFHHTVAPSL